MMKKLQFSLLVFFLVAFVIYFFKPFGGVNLLVEKAIYQVISFMALGMGVIAIRNFGLGGSRGISFILILFGVLFWVLGDSVWNYYIVTNTEIPFPSIGDVFYMFGYPTLFFGLIREVMLANVNIKKIKPAFFIGTGFFALLLISFFLYISIYLTYSPEASFYENLVTIGYGVGDILLVISSLFLILLIREYKEGNITKLWRYLFASFSLSLAADVLYGIFTAEIESGVGFIPTLTDLLYIAAFCFVLLGFATLQDSLYKVKRSLLAIKKAK